MKTTEIEKEEPYNEDYAIINGIWLRRENEKLRYCEHFTFEEAPKIASMYENLRVPINDEWVKMLELGSTWDDKLKGIWIGKNHHLKKETNYSTFLPAAGYRSSSNGQLYDSGINGFYWSATAYGDFSFSLTFTSGHVLPANYNYRSYGFSVRCIVELSV